MNTWLSILPPIFAIILALITKQVYISLFIGIWLGWTILSEFNPLLGLVNSIDAIINVFKEPANTRVIIFSALVGALIALTQRSGGVQGFINLVSRRSFINSRRKAQIFAWAIGMSIFVESSITCLVTGTVSRPIFDKFKISREKLAYICDSTSAPVCIMIPLNAWGAYVIGLLTQVGVKNEIQLFISALPFNFYAIFAILLVLFIGLTGFDFGPMKKAELRAIHEGKVIADGAMPLIADEVINIPPKSDANPKARNMIIPILTMILMMPIGLYITGNGNITNGSGSTSVLWSVMTSIFVAGFLYKIQKILSIRETIELTLKGMGGLIPLAVLMTFAFAIGAVCKELKTGEYVAHIVSKFINPKLLPSIVFLTSCFISFSTGTSWGTFAIMIPISVPAGIALGSNLSLIIASVLSGGVFGDHCSPISDTTIVSSMASACDHLDHVKTQLPYAITAASFALIFFTIFGFILN
ncbi:Na+/H+ antiporter NhaC [Candidatus Kryptobacter tengchongensis]|uniref:Na+/H+ antiporter NhaC family protein n=1 Tax=Kryptobacter tengchongensis TaxID=1643429 RepID=UPI00070833EC|nr:Na+/H+ antiporter NhaC family protein [Candidatus Kryptobacter tengchongensis]CUS88630.1 Na+/H+ antiporter NhaC [Candidatus Kryptobacter tengchongensis]CUU06523.1 Na+/H+ antiporter NhaC [Candidatus Kryptobacter tengchongensis]